MGEFLKSKLILEDFIIKKITHDIFILFKKNSAFWMTINSSGLKIFDLISKGFQKEEIVEMMVDIYHVPAEYIERDYDRFVELMRNKLDRADHISQIEKESKMKINGKTITIHITNRCNLSCPYCYKDANTNLCELSQEEILKIVAESYELGFKDFTFSGGEPTIRTDLFEILNEVKEKYSDCNFNLITNGTVELKDEYIDILTRTLSAIQISIDSSKEEENAKTRGIGNVEKVKKFATNLAKRNYKNFYFACVPYTKSMDASVEDNTVPLLMRLSAYLGGKGLYINMLKPNGRMNLEGYSNYNIDDFWEIVDKTIEEQEQLYNIGYRELSLFAAGDFANILVEHKHKAGCGAGVAELSIDNDGNVYPCPSLMLPEFLLGNIRELSMRKIYEIAYDMFKDITVDHIEECKECPARYICGGGCRAMAYLLKGDIKAANPHCEQAKKRMDLWMKLSMRLDKTV